MAGKDCFDTGSRVLTVAQALDLIASRFTAVSEPEQVPLGRVLGRVLAADIVSVLDLPPFDNAAMDGYAVRATDLGRRLPVAGTLYAGSAPVAAPKPGAALRIFTGAVMPDGLDTVVMQEEVRVEGDFVHLPAGLSPGLNVRRRGEDVAVGQVALPTGRRLRAVDIGLAAALGQDFLTIRRPLRVALFSTGDEVTAPGRALAPGGIYDANRPLLSALLSQMGCAVTDLGILADDEGVIRAALAAAAADHDLILTSGGVSAGDADHVKAAVRTLGGLDLWKLALKPGKPLALGHVGAAAFAGLPGNPVAMLVSFLVLVRPLIDRLSGAVPAPLPLLTAPAGFAHAKKAGRREYLRVSIGPDGVAHADPTEGAAMLGHLTRADALAELGEEVTAVRPGDPVRVLPLGMLGT
ncbi:MAG: molybdopterin molybdotransferase MoeA [Niveispirillum sp.]|uniref:molybdopterin molybdotransferase MoeA n=1 Tax=Niveispirillum sp. TaxID=1917217 RepID=UPI004035E28A